MMRPRYIEDVIDLTDPALNHIQNMSVEEARARVRSGDPKAVRAIEGSFALVARDGKTVRLARSMDRPMRYFLAKREDGPALVVAHRIEEIHRWLQSVGFADQFHPNYTRMVPAHYVVTLELIGCPDPAPAYTRFFEIPTETLPPDLPTIGRYYIGALKEEIRRWLLSIPEDEPIGVTFSGGIDSGSVFLVTYHTLLELGMNPGRLKAFTLDLGDGPDRNQAFTFLQKLGLELFWEPVEAGPELIDIREVVRLVEDYKPLDIESAAMHYALARALRRRYPDWKYLLDGEGGDENLRAYPIEHNPELTVYSIINNPLLYHEGWGVDKFKHSLTYTGGLSRAYTRTFAINRHFGFEGFSPYTRPNVIEVAEKIPFAELTGYDKEKLYRLKGEVVYHGVRAVTGFEMPVFEKRRFQHGALPEARLRELIPAERQLRRMVEDLFVS
ncbi:asparagine synthase-related protein [Rhodothermus marinus]|uniref:asparagine synthase-related protein n=1 Tax=Rhodothermus marinus TaxID=29549 RepID=UPI00396DA165